MAFKTRQLAISFLIFFIWGCQSQTSKDYELGNSYKTNENEAAHVKNEEVLIKRSNSTVTGNEHSIASWNIKELGKTKNQEEIHDIAQIIRDFDLVLIQEVVGKDPAGIQAVAKIVDELNRMGFKWDYSVSDPTHSPSANKSERYGFLWKTSRVSLKGRPRLDTELSDVCDREPYIGKFLFKNQSEPISVINFHSRVHDNHPENEIFYLQNYQERLETTNIIVGGDFNLDDKHAIWNSFYRKGYKSALTNTPTTLKTKCDLGNYLNDAIDNLYFSNSITVIESGSIDFVRDCKNLENARKLSDHLPIFMRFL
jgi:deoxyribonuclease-1-like protein